ncbi:MAG: SpoVG family protein [Clostridia bacterium]|nr:SpoVG family protein [Clostridia bacterium]
MKITEVKIHPVNTEGNLKAFVSITLDKQFVVGGLAVMNGTKGLFVKMPSRKVGDEYKDTCYPVTKEFRQELVDTVLAEYRRVSVDSYQDNVEVEEPLPF